MLTEGPLKKAGYQTILAESVKEARPHFLNPDIQLVVTDLKMPGEDGHAVIHWFLNNRPEVPVIVFSANAHQRNRILTALIEAESEQSGVLYVEKPDFATLFHAIAAKLP